MGREIRRVPPDWEHPKHLHQYAGRSDSPSRAVVWKHHLGPGVNPVELRGRASVVGVGMDAHEGGIVVWTLEEPAGPWRAWELLLCQTGEALDIDVSQWRPVGTTVSAAGTVWHVLERARVWP